MITVVLDIDGVLACSEDSPEALAQQVNVDYFKKRGLYFECGGSVHCIHPAVPAFLRALYAIPNAEIVFFSAGTSERNEKLVERLMTLAFGASSSQAKPRIFSRGHQTKASSYEALTYPKELNGFQGENKKDLLTVVTKKELRDTIIIDDLAGNILPSQARHFMMVPSLLAFHYHHVRAYREELPIEQLLTNDETTQRYNNIYWAMGMLSMCLEQKEKSPEKSLTDILWKIVRRETGGMVLVNYAKRWKDPDIYKRGLETLLRYDPTLTFLNPNVIANEPDEELSAAAGAEAAPWRNTPKAFEIPACDPRLFSSTDTLHDRLVKVFASVDTSTDQKLSEGSASP